MNFLKIIAGTPLWVWGGLAYLILRGVLAFNTRTVSVYKIFILPAIFLYLSLNGLFLQHGIMSFMTLARFLSLFAGGFIGFMLAKEIVIRADKKNKTIEIPGNKFTLLLVLAIFGVKYYFGFKAATDPVLAATLTFMLSKIIITGIISGTSLGRAACYFYKYRTTNHINLA
ncbi:DUF6622 family protein [Candidatus Dependentiae bacterium]